MGFRDYLESSEEARDVQDTLALLPPKIQKLVSGFRVNFQGGNTLKGDEQHVGLIQTHPRPTITIAAPFLHSRQTVLLHEVAHLVWEYLVPDPMKREWEQIVKSTPDKPNQPAEELFCMTFACFYSKHKEETYNRRKWLDFVRKVVAH